MRSSGRAEEAQMKNWGFWAATSVVASVVSFPGHGQGQEPIPEEPVPGLNGVRTHRMGRVAGSSVGGGGIEIAPAEVDVSGGKSEAQVAGPAARALAPAPAGTIEEAELASEIAARFETLDDCRIEVARSRHVLIAAVQADRLTLRWTIVDTGEVTDATAVGTTPVDADVLDCVKRQMTSWTFSAPSGGPMPVERVFKFRPVRTEGAFEGQRGAHFHVEPNEQGRDSMENW